MTSAAPDGGLPPLKTAPTSEEARSLVVPNSSASKGDALSGSRHLIEALQLASTISRRFKREGRSFSEEEKRLITQLYNDTTGTTSTPQGLVESNPQTESLSQIQAVQSVPSAAVPPVVDTNSATTARPESRESAGGSTTSARNDRPPSGQSTTAAGRKKDLFSALKKATTSAGMYQQILASKSVMADLTDFAVRCTSMVEHVDIIHALQSELHKVNPAETASIYIRDAIDDTLLVDPLNGDLCTAVTLDEVLNHKEEVSFSKGCFMIHLIKVEQVFLGAIVFEEKADDGHGSVIIEPRSEETLQRISAIVGIAALSLRNIRLYDNVKWQMEKANAMLMMANQLSRDNLQEDVLVNSIIETARNLTESDRCSVFLVKGNELQAHFANSKPIRMPLNTGIAGHVATTGETVNILDAYQDDRFNASVDKATGYRTKSILCLPIRYEGAIVAVAQLINKLPQKKGAALHERVYSSRDEELFVTFSTMIGVCLRNCRVNAQLTLEREKTEVLLAAAANLAESDITDVNDTVSRVIHGAKDLLGADRATLFLLDKEHDELYSKIADKTGGSEIRFPLGKGIAGTVASSGVAENILDAYDDERFNREVDKKLGYRTKSILCQPIFCRGEVLAVAQLVNKMDGKSEEVESFNTTDETSFNQFATFAGIALSNAQLLNFAITAGEEAMALNNTDAMMEGSFRTSRSRSSSLVSVKNAVTSATMQEVLEMELEDGIVERAQTTDFNLFEFRDHYGPDKAGQAAAKLIVKLIMSSGLPEKLNCDEDVLLRFVCHCRRKYRKVPYHNFFHVVDACQTIYCYLFRGGLIDQVTEVEAFTLLITALAHDLDHMGLNNSFHMKTDSPLGILSSASGNRSVLEVHHCNIVIEILEDAQANVFSGLETADKSHAYRVMIDTILATDMARHGELLEAFAAVGKDGYDKANAEHRKLAIQMTMKAADISNVTKPFDISRIWASCVTEEFHQQGDKEKERGVEVLPMFDRGRAGELAEGQIGFISFVASKFFNESAEVFPQLQWTVDNIEANTARWKSILEDHKQAQAAAAYAKGASDSA